MKKFAIVALLLTSAFLFADEAMMRLELLLKGYYPEYKNYHFDEPVWSFEGYGDIINLAENFGIGAGASVSFKSYQTYIAEKKHYDFYMHNFWNTYEADNYFIYGFYFGGRQNDLLVQEPGAINEVQIRFFRFLAGFEFSNENWGFEVKATQNESKKMMFATEVKYRRDNRLIFKLGRSNRGPISGMKSEIYFQMGYEFFLGK